MNRGIRITGTGNIKVKPDMTRVTMTISDIDKQYEKALTVSAQNSESLRKIESELGFSASDLKTVSFDVKVENTSYRDRNDNWRERFVGYRVNHCLKIEFESDNTVLGKLLGAVAGCNAKPQINISFFVKDTEGAKNMLLGNAIRDAKQKASVLAEASGVVLKEIQSIDYSWGELRFESRPEMIGMEPEGVLEDLRMDIEPDDIDATDNVTVVWAIE